MGGDIYSIGKATDYHQILKVCQLLYEFLTESYAIAGSLSGAYNTDDLFISPIYIPAGEKKDRRINDLLEVRRVITIKESMVADMVVLDIAPFFLGSLTMYGVKKVLENNIADTAYMGNLVFFLLVDSRRTSTMDNEFLCGDISYIGGMLQGQQGDDIFFFHGLFLFPYIVGRGNALERCLERIAYLKSVNKGV